MSIGSALIIAVSGFLVVFLMLCLLWGIIVMINKVVISLPGTRKKEAPAVSAEVTPEPAPVKAAPVRDETTYGGELALYDVDEKTAACIMAIISDETKIPLSQLIFKSIRALD